MDHTSRITAKGQTTIPAEIRAQLGVGSGDTIRYVLSGDRVYIVPRNRPVSIIFDIAAKFAKVGTTTEDYREAAAAGAAERESRRLREDVSA